MGRATQNIRVVVVRQHVSPSLLRTIDGSRDTDIERVQPFRQRLFTLSLYHHVYVIIHYGKVHEP